MFITIDRNSRISIKKQLYDGLIKFIFDGSYGQKYRLPSSRALATQLDIARNTVIEIYEQLVAEGYCYSEKGKGTYISDGISDMSDHTKISKGSIADHSEEIDEFRSETSISLYAGKPDLDYFPRKHWLKYTKEYLYGPKNKLMGFADLKGYLPLRKELATYLRMHKGIDCSVRNIFITNGTSGALNKIALAMMKSRDILITEAYGIDFVPNIFESYNYEVQCVSVDLQGMVTDDLPDHMINQLVYTTPSHQMPVGGVLPFTRRQTLIDYARTHKHYIIEDDYDSEFRYVGAQVNALKQIESELVIYLGTFSKTLGPELRIGYMVVPDSLVDTFDDVYDKTFARVQFMDQYCLYRLIEDGQFEKSILKMTRLYKKKREHLLKNIDFLLKDQVTVLGNETGLHVLLKFKDKRFLVDDKRIFEDVGLLVDYLEDYIVGPLKSKETDTIIFGFGHLSMDEIDEGVKRLSMLEGR